MSASNGTALVLQLDSSTIVCETESSMNLTNDMIETTCKGSGKNKTYISGELDATIDFTANYDSSSSTSFGYSEAFTAMNAGTTVAFVFGSTAAGEKNYTGNAYFSDLSQENPQNDRSTWSGTLQVTGAVTEATNP